MKKIINEKLTGIGLLVLAAVFAMYAFLEYRKTEPTPSVTTPKPAPALAFKPTPTPPEKSKPISTITILDIPSFEVGETRSIIAIAKDASGNLVEDCESPVVDSFTIIGKDLNALPIKTDFKEHFYPLKELNDSFT